MIKYSQTNDCTVAFIFNDRSITWFPFIRALWVFNPITLHEPSVTASMYRVHPHLWPLLFYPGNALTNTWSKPIFQTSAHKYNYLLSLQSMSYRHFYSNFIIFLFQKLFPFIPPIILFLKIARKASHTLSWSTIWSQSGTQFFDLNLLGISWTHSFLFLMDLL